MSTHIYLSLEVKHSGCNLKLMLAVSGWMLMLAHSFATAVAGLFYVTLPCSALPALLCLWLCATLTKEQPNGGEMSHSVAKTERSSKNDQNGKFHHDFMMILEVDQKEKSVISAPQIQVFFCFVFFFYHTRHTHINPKSLIHFGTAE